MKRGRRSNDSSAALDLVCSKAIKMFESTALEYGLAPEQVFVHSQKTEQRFRNIDNPWNIYQRYFNCFVKEETSRLLEDLQSTIRASGGRVSSTDLILLPSLLSSFALIAAAIKTQCWHAFRNFHGDTSTFCRNLTTFTMPVCWILMMRMKSSSFQRICRVLGWLARESENSKTTQLVVPHLRTNPNGPVRPPVRRE